MRGTDGRQGHDTRLEEVLRGGAPLGPSLGRSGKAPPIEPFSGEKAGMEFDEWLPTLERAAEWYVWNPKEKLLQLAGHLKSREWTLLEESDRHEYGTAVKALQNRFAAGSRTLAAQEFRHIRQR